MMPEGIMVPVPELDSSYSENRCTWLPSEMARHKAMVRPEVLMDRSIQAKRPWQSKRLESALPHERRYFAFACRAAVLDGDVGLLVIRWF
jgi:hypothetical protein